MQYLLAAVAESGVGAKKFKLSVVAKSKSNP
jgi:hypothetical protein